MPDRIELRDAKQIVRQYRREVTKELRAQGRRVLKEVRRAAPKGKTGNLRRKIKQKVRWDADGPYVRITTSARRTTKHRDGTTSSYRYGLAIQQERRYLQEGLNRTPRQ